MSYCDITDSAHPVPMTTIRHWEMDSHPLHNDPEGFLTKLGWTAEGRQRLQCIR